MNESDKQKEYRRFRRLDILGKIGWLISFRFLRPSWWWGRREGLFLDEPPLVSLAKLAEEGLQNPVDRHKLNEANLQRAMELFAAAMKGDDGFSEDESAIVQEFLKDYAPENLIDEIDRLIEEVKRSEDTNLQLRNSMFLLKKNVHSSMLKAVVGTLHRIAFLNGFDSKQARNASDMAIRMGLSHTEIRLISSEIRRKLQEENDGNITG